MVAIPNKRQQARNERALQDLIRTVPGNDRCADCDARNPTWASWNLGAFLCMRCAALHRKMGTHISKVKSLSMDSWTSEQVENMQKNGNARVNKIYNPRNVKPPIPIDADEVDAAMERFIRQKYESQILEDGKPKPPKRDDSSYHARKLSEDSPPPPPPKTGKRFGFGLRMVSSASHLSRSSDRHSNSSNPTSPARSEPFGSLSIPIPMNNKISRVSGSSIGSPVEAGSSFESKLATLRDMGFPDDRRNATVLRGLSGDLERTIESLVRLGEGSDPGSRARTPRLTPTSGHFPSGLTSPRSENSNANPFDQLDVPTTTALPHHMGPGITTSSSNNPFDALTSHPSTIPTTAVEAALQSLQISPQLDGTRQPQQQTTQSPAVSAPQTLSNGFNPFGQPPPLVHPNHQPGRFNTFPLANPTSSPSISSNPFFSQIAPQVTVSQPPMPFMPAVPQPLTQSPVSYMSASSFFSSPAISPQPSPALPFGGQVPSPHTISPQQPYNPFDPLPSNSPQSIPQQPLNQTTSPFFMTQQNTSQQAQPLYYQQTGRVDKNSILALYNLPSATSSNLSPNEVYAYPQQQQFSQQSQAMQTPAPLHLSSRPIMHVTETSPAPSLLTNSVGSTPQVQFPYDVPSPQRNVTMPNITGIAPGVGGTRNPFFSTPPLAGQTGAGSSNGPIRIPTSGLGIGMGFTQQPAPTSGSSNLNVFVSNKTHMSQASVDISGLQNGRHSPDAFASLSARYT